MLSRLHKSQKGFTLVEIMIVVAIIGILVAIAVPGFIRARTQAQAQACKEAQQKMNGACQQYYLEENTNTPPGYAGLVGPELFLQSTPTCPKEGLAIAIPADSSTNAVCPSSDADHVLE